MKRILTLALALCLSLILVTALAVDQHDKDYFDTQVQLLADNLQKFYEENYGEGDLVAPYDLSLIHI